MLGIVQFIAVLSTALFAGAAFFLVLVVNFAKEGGAGPTPIEWLLTARRGMGAQTLLAVLGGLAGLLAWLMCGAVLWVIGAFLILAAIPFNPLPFTPERKHLVDPAQGSGQAKTGELLKKCRRVHLARTVLSSAASCIYLALVVRT